MNKLSFSVFVINLDKDVDRLAFMDAQLRKLSIEYERQPALRGTDIDPNEYNESEALERGKHALIPGELGCAASHKRIYQHMLERGLEYAIVLEDDVELPSDFKSILIHEIERNKGQWEYLLFDYWQPGTIFIRRWFDSAVNAFRAAKGRGGSSVGVFLLYTALKACYVVPLSLFEGWRNEHKKQHPGPVKFYRPLYLAGAYLVSLDGAKKLLSLSSPIVYTADKLPNQARVQKDLRFYAYAPLSVYQRKDEFGSSILDIPGGKL
jgi:GR25 family glycosyltransferase involved in LPS biosynthesis